MLDRFLACLALTLAAIGFTSCSGGGAGPSVAAANCEGNDPNVLCLQSCNLGCTATGCELTDIAQNQPIILGFNQAVDPRTVNNTTIQFRTPSGEEPVGDFLVNGSIVQFVPQVLVVGNSSFFGFRANETYRLTLPGGPNEINSVRSTGGDRMVSTFSCSLRVTRGIIDLNQSPPRARLITPSSVFNVPIDTAIVLEFNELLDVTPFAGTTASNGPVEYFVRQTRPQGGVPGAPPECNPNSPLQRMVGPTNLSLDPIRGVSVLRYQPPVRLPGEICVQVNVTDRVLDLAGVPATPQSFQFITEETARITESIVEDFEDDAFLDRDVSSGTWSGGRGRFGQIGGDGLHGPFDPSLGTSLGLIAGKDTYEWNTENLMIGGQQTLTGNSVTVQDGRFFFTQMTLPRNVRLRFTGNNPVVFTVRGRIDIEGEIELRGLDVEGNFPASSATGQPGGLGAAFAGDGGAGGDKALGTGASPAFDGRPGEDVRVPAGHAFAGNTAGTGGRGSPLFPASGQNAAVVAPSPTALFSLQTTSGGGGGGNREAGGQGQAVSNSANNPAFLGPPSAGGIAFVLDADPSTPGTIQVPSGSVSSQHFLVGGSGGGGGGSHPLFSFISMVVPPTWSAGAAGAGGGGALALRAGDFLRVSSSGTLLCQGGSGAAYTGTTTAPTPAPGGGGSGGAILLQAGRATGQATDLAGVLDVSGGTGGSIVRGTPFLGSVVVRAGDGSRGYLRLETPGTPTPGLMPGALPPATVENVAPLTEVDARVGFQSEFYSTQQQFAPQYLRYEMEAIVGGNRVVYSDDPGVGVLARPGTQPVGVLFQAATIDLFTGAPDPTSIERWRVFVGPFGAATGERGLADDGRNGFRFVVILDRSFGQTVEIDKVTVFYRI